MYGGQTTAAAGSANGNTVELGTGRTVGGVVYGGYAKVTAVLPAVPAVIK